MRSAEPQTHLGPSIRPARHSITKECLAWLTRCIQQTLVYPLKQAPVLPCLAAADACVEGDEIGIGGWILSRSQVVWFGETWKYTEAQAAWPCLQAQNAQAYIACFEAWHNSPS